MVMAGLTGAHLFFKRTGVQPNPAPESNQSDSGPGEAT